jgi:hypothetical protein
MKEKQAKKLLENQQRIISQNKKIINILSGTTSDQEAAYEDVKEMAKNSPHGITRKQAAVVLDIHPNNVGTHFAKIEDENKDFIVAEDSSRKGKPEILVHSKSTVVEGRKAGKNQKNRNLENNPMLS